MKILRYSLLLAVLGSSFAAHAQEIVKDGNFEQAAGAPNTFSFYANGTSFDGGLWTVGPGPNGETSSVIIDKTDGFINGTASAVLNGNSIFQDLTTVVGRTYLVQFDAYSSAVPTSTNLLQVSFGITSLSVAVPVGEPAAHFFFYATATSTTTTLRFSQARGNNFVTLDGVTAAPEPGTWAALGLGAAALMRRRRRA